MSDGIRKAWLLDYHIAYAEQHGSELSSSQLKRGKVQIVNFRTLPESPEEWVWADVSDKKHIATVRFTMEAVKSFNSDLRNAGRRLTSRRWGIATIRCTHPLWCRPPTENGKGLEDNWTIALVVDQVEVTASEGEAMFGQPRCVTKEEPMQRWLEGLRNPDGVGGDVLRLERLQREKKEEEAIILDDKGGPGRTYREAVSKFDTSALDSNENSIKRKHRQRSKQWMEKMNEIGMVLTYECHQIPEDQLRSLEGITVFGLNAPQEQNVFAEASLPASTPTTIKHRVSSPVDPCQVRFGEPTTPSHWSASQQPNIAEGPEDDENESNESIVSQSTSSVLENVIDHKEGKAKSEVTENERPAVREESGRLANEPLHSPETEAFLIRDQEDAVIRQNSAVIDKVNEQNVYPRGHPSSGTDRHEAYSPVDDFKLQESSPVQGISPEARYGSSETHEPMLLKLGGWRPRKDVPRGPGVMTWEKFNKMLLTVGRVREEANRSESKT